MPTPNTCQLYVDDPQATPTVVLQDPKPHITQLSCTTSVPWKACMKRRTAVESRKEQQKLGLRFTWCCLIQGFRTGAFILPFLSQR
jgi:hypothetical protein